ncbi:helix-turn-helix domain-containing protein [Neisseria animaloris]|uniref:helix-turn-helix domain-containing protein n=1 Tax=Neisseria animaloris TaxID=326522 RepID=UPI001F43BDE4|nr:LysR family transcriptional regulator [Neisseria animaloris]
MLENVSFTRAAEYLSISSPMASKHVSHFVNTLQDKFLHRNSCKLHFTKTGKEYYHQ